MDFKTTMFTLLNLPPKRSVYIMGNHGLGKSELVAQTAAKMAKMLNKPFGFIDLRLSQREVGDVIGTPRAHDTWTVRMPAFDPAGKKIFTEVEAKQVMAHDLPLWFPTDPDSCGYLFLDELPYAQRDVLNAIFELALDYRMNFNVLPAGWRVIAAGNHNQDIYGGTTINPALWSRFFKINFKPTVPEWLEYASSVNVLPAIRSYIKKIPRDLDPPEEMESGVTYPDRRSWMMLSQDIQYMTENGNNPMKDLDYLTFLAKGRLGDAISINWVEYVRKEFKLYTASDIVNNFNNKNTEDDFRKMEAPSIPYYCSEVVSYLVAENKPLTKKQSENLKRFMMTIPKDCASGLWFELVKTWRENAVKWYNDTPGVIDYLASILMKDKAVV
jgi:hypothetical protein